MTKTLSQFLFEAKADTAGVRFFHKLYRGVGETERHKEEMDKIAKQHGGKVMSHNVKYDGKTGATIIKVPKLHQKPLVGAVMKHKHSIIAMNSSIK